MVETKLKKERRKKTGQEKDPTQEVQEGQTGQLTCRSKALRVVVPSYTDHVEKIAVVDKGTDGPETFVLGVVVTLIETPDPRSPPGG